MAHMVVLTLLASLIDAREINPGVDSRSASIGPAAAVVAPSSSKKEAAYFQWETVQLTDAVLSGLAQSNATIPVGLFGFDGGCSNSSSVQCKAFPGDNDWPSPETWQAFDTLTGGALIKTVPLAAPCYPGWPEYSESQCAYVTGNWNDPHLHVADPTSNQWPLYEGLTCVPPSLRNESTNCTLGGYPAYSVNVTNVAQIQLALNFARRANLRLVVKNTGHDFADKSLGAGALSLWTHQLNDLKYYADYSYGNYHGPAFKLGTGVTTERVYLAAEQNNVTAVGGECRTVALAGGYIAGGGHSPMSSLVGMAADQVLSMEVVLPSGRFVTASSNENPDLFWALRGGGGSTYGVVTSLVVRAYPEVPVTTMTFTFATGANLTADTFWDGIRAFMSHFNTFVDAGTYSYFLVAPGPDAGDFSFLFDPFWGLNLTQPQLESLVGPFLAELAALGIPVTPVYTEYPSLYPAWNASFPPEHVGTWTDTAASRLFPRANFASAAAINTTLAAVRYAVTAGGVLIGYNIRMAPNAAPGVSQDNAANEAWRATVTHFILAATWGADATDAQIAAASETLTTDWMARWRAASPGAGAYMSEADANEPDWQQAFFGTDNYARLYALKQQLDPTGLFYAHQAVGSEDWYVTGQVDWIPTQNGRLCRKKT